jgi:flavin-dependent dehydrogenase
MYLVLLVKLKPKDRLNLDYPKTMQLFMGEIVGGYGYIFPKGNDRADVGVGARPYYGKDPFSAKSFVIPIWINRSMN